MFRFVSLHVVMACLLLAGTAALASAQGRAAGSLDELIRVVRPNTEIVLTDNYGSEFSGVLSRLTSSELTLSVEGRPRVFDSSEIVRIRARRRDSLVNGTLWGLAAGAGTVLTMTALASGANYYIHERDAAIGVAVFGCAGAGLGALFDALKRSRVTVYEGNTPRSPVTFRLSVAPTRRVALVDLRF